ncbi:MAG TPA: hypothetical protein VLF94_04685 [Chlamydiales bacterium]|nr:hypothetical protein [Chlamydiales bacterium]
MAASVKNDWKIALMQQVLFGVECPSREQGMSCFSEKAMMERVRRIAKIAKTVEPRDVEPAEKKSCLTELKAHVDILIRHLERLQERGREKIRGWQSVCDTNRSVFKFLQDPKVQNPKGDPLDRKRHLEDTASHTADIEKVIAETKKKFGPESEIARDIQLLKAWRSGLAGCKFTAISGQWGRSAPC